MITKTITYEDWNGNKRTEEHCFHLSKHELTMMDLTAQGGLETQMRRICQERDNRKLAELFTGIIKSSYGVKTDDGKNFKKTEEAYENFVSSGAYEQLFMELATDEDALLKFINGILPKDMQDEIKEKGILDKENIQKMLDENA